MRQLREILRLKFESRWSHRAIAEACSVSVGAVSLYVGRAVRAGLEWPLPAELNDAALEARLFDKVAVGAGPRPAPDCGYIHQELKRPGVTRHLLWLEYLEAHPDGYRYSQFCEAYRRYVKQLSPTMRQRHRPGEKVFTDFSGKRPHVADRHSGELVPVELFVAAMGASHFIYAEATARQDLRSWIGAHIRMVEYFGGSPAVWVPDQLKSAITVPCRYEPKINRSFRELARHYSAVVIPARPGKARDKAKVETAVQVAQRWILARLRHRVYSRFRRSCAARSAESRRPRRRWSAPTRYREK